VLSDRLLPLLLVLRNEAGRKIELEAHVSHDIIWGLEPLQTHLVNRGS
jgi:hypothetical protein